MKNQKIFFISYATKNFTTAGRHLIRLAKKSNLFEEAILFSPNDLSATFKEKYADIIKQPRGAGYWIWKQEIIKNMLINVNKNDLVVYCDSGSSFNINGTDRFKEYVEMLNDSSFGNFRIQCEKKHIEKFWTTKEIFTYFQISPNSEEGNSTQLEATEIIFKKNSHTKEFLQIYDNILNVDEKLISDYYNNSQQIKGFNENRHDQSIFSMISKTHGSVVIENETNFEDRKDEQLKAPFLAVRTYGHGRKDRLKYLINYKKKYDNPVLFE